AVGRIDDRGAVIDTVMVERSSRHPLDGGRPSVRGADHRGAPEGTAVGERQRAGLVGEMPDPARTRPDRRRVSGGREDGTSIGHLQDGRLLVPKGGQPYPSGEGARKGSVALDLVAQRGAVQA